MSNAIVYATAILIVVLNLIIIIVLQCKINIKYIVIVLSAFQRFHTKTGEKASSIAKMFMVQLINTGIIILLVNARIP